MPRKKNESPIERLQTLAQKEARLREAGAKNAQAQREQVRLLERHARWTLADWLRAKNHPAINECVADLEARGSKVQALEIRQWIKPEGDSK